LNLQCGFVDAHRIGSQVPLQSLLVNPDAWSTPLNELFDPTVWPSDADIVPYVRIMDFNAFVLYTQQLIAINREYMNGEVSP
jgi:hypothetical protein